MSEQPVAEETLDMRTCGMAKPDPIAWVDFEFSCSLISQPISTTHF